MSVWGLFRLGWCMMVFDCWHSMNGCLESSVTQDWNQPSLKLTVIYGTFPFSISAAIARDSLLIEICLFIEPRDMVIKKVVLQLDLKPRMPWTLYWVDHFLIVIGEFIWCPQKISRGNKLIRRHYLKSKSVRRVRSGSIFWQRDSYFGGRWNSNRMKDLERRGESG